MMISPRGFKNIMVWYRNDLRIHDHQPLVEACEKGQFVIPVFCFDQGAFELTPYGTFKTGFFRTKFLIESVNNLRNSFIERGANLLVRLGSPEEIIPDLAIRFGVQTVLAFKEVATEEIIQGDLIEKKLWKNGISMNLYLGNTLFNKEDLPFPIKDVPDVFTNFRKKVEKDSFVRECFPIPIEIRVPNDISWGTIPSLDELGIKELPFDKREVLHFEGGETKGLERIKEFIWVNESIKTYKQTRNRLLGSEYSSKLSPWLSLGCISPRKVYAEIKLFEKEVLSNDSTQHLLFELLWRDYFRFIFKKYGSKLFLEKGITGKVIKTNSEFQSFVFDKWKMGETGFPFIDANMRELNATGFMSNRGRQNVASFLIHDLKVNWTLGAAYFEERLIDYNPSNNWGNWAYLAGVGNDPRENRCFNILKQALEYDPKGEYIQTWIPELKSIDPKFIHQPHKMVSGNIQNFSYPPPIIEPKEYLTFN